ncbi:uncharacterized protein LTR77_002983 [Saxophila tyrrhenica]|uniref:Uncharacterized protein n=1 Tax=Saxophila tyrrhenica TaxID=1690608 RepID=A0AAV9PKK6_9PEZI|nr:hypothetical protein LTR77_002983 [Saxophila tyrrhenica]
MSEQPRAESPRQRWRRPPRGAKTKNERANFDIILCRTMGSRNAFANGDSDQLHPMERHPEAQPAKRARLAEDAVASIYSQVSNTDTSLEVDHMILDYVAYQTIQACLASRDPTRQSGSSQALASNLAMADSFMSIFRTRHPTYKPDAELRLRSMLLKFITLFTQRLTRNPTTPPREDLRALRTSNQQRAREWIGSADRMPSAILSSDAFDKDLPIAEQSLERNRAHVLSKLDIPPEDDHYEDAFYGTSDCVSLIDLCPLFMRLSAARNAMNGSNLTELWMELACELMLQACLEHYLVFGAHGTDAIDEAFAWGYKTAEDDSQTSANNVDASSVNHDEVNAMFEDDEFEMEAEGWAEIKMSYLRRLQPDRAVPEKDTAALLGMVATQHPVEAFEKRLLTYLSALSESMVKPVLVQLENGQLDGMTQQETKDFLATCNIGDLQSFTLSNGR